MIITKDMIDAVAPFAEGYPPTNKVYKNETAVLKELLKTSELSLILRLPTDDRSKPSFHLHFHRFSIEICQGDTFTFLPSLDWIDSNDKPFTLNDYIEMGGKCARIWEHKHSIMNLVSLMFKDRDRFIQLNKIRGSARWAFERMNQFFEIYSDGKEVDTEKVLKPLYKIKLEDKNVPFFVNKYPGKQQCFGTMRRVIDYFYETFQEITNDPSLVMPVTS